MKGKCPFGKCNRQGRCSDCYITFCGILFSTMYANLQSLVRNCRIIAYPLQGLVPQSLRFDLILAVSKCEKVYYKAQLRFLVRGSTGSRR